MLAKARKINELAGLCARFLPAALARHARAANLKDGTLVILADNPAVAAKLKLFSESLGEYLSKQRPEVNSVSVRVQPAYAAVHDEPARVKSALSAAALAELRNLHSRLRDSPARGALGLLLEHHDGSRRGAAAPRGKKTVATRPPARRARKT